jgi:hypothetical protein
VLRIAATIWEVKMTATDASGHGLDPAHILGIALQSTGRVRGRGARVMALTASGHVHVSLPSRRAAIGAAAMLDRVGYQVTRIGGLRRPDVLVTGWSTAGLEARLAAMRAVFHQLDATPQATATAVIDRTRHRPAGSPVVPAVEVLADARARLRAWVSARSGHHVPHVSAVLPADRGNALRLRTAWSLETEIDHLVDRQVRTAEHALSLFHSLRQYATDDLAQQLAIRRVSLPGQPDPSLAQDSSALMRRAARPPGARPRSGAPPRAAGPIRRTARPPGRGPRFAAPPPGGPAGPARLAASGFPQPLTRVVKARDATVARPGGRLFSARRPGPRR